MSTLLKNGLLWTDGEARSFSYVSIKDGWICNVLFEGNPSFNESSFTNIVDAKGGLVLPGLHDSHIHVAMLGESRYFLNLIDCYSIEYLKEMLRKHLLLYPDINYIQGVNWDQTKLGRYPNRFDLDDVCATKPIFLWRACWHIGVGNTKSLTIGGIDVTATAQPVSGGVIDCDSDTKLPNGILKERACELVTVTLNQKSPEEKIKFIKDGVDLCLSMGLTSVHTNDEKSVNLYKSLRDSHQLPIRVFLTPNYNDLSVPCDEGGCLDAPPIHAVSVFDPNKPMNSPDSKLVIDRVKIFADGSLGAETAAIRTEACAGSYNGVLIHDLDSLVTFNADAKSKNYRVEIHAIGDAAADVVLKSLELANISPLERPVLTHCQVLGHDLLEKMKTLNVIANIQPSFVPTDMKWVSQRLSSSKQQHAYVWKSMLQMGIHVAGGSDAPIESPSPFLGMFDAIFRRDRNDPNIVFKPEEKLSLAEAISIYTHGGAYASGTEHVLGEVKEGYVADIIIVDPRVLSDHSLLASTKPSIVIVGGDVVYRDSTAAPSATVPMQSNFIPGKNGPFAFLSADSCSSSKFCRCKLVKKCF